MQPRTKRGSIVIVVVVVAQSLDGVWVPGVARLAGLTDATTLIGVGERYVGLARSPRGTSVLYGLLEGVGLTAVCAFDDRQ